jgi:7,8-dihydro-6-hydroxymethylpterin dimethyltransferase
MTSLSLRDHRFLGTTQSMCPETYEIVPAKIIERDGRVFFRKTCPGGIVREDMVCSDVRWFDRMEYSLPGKVPKSFAIEPRRGCPYDCGLCTEHEQHTCVAVLEITSSCNLTCPMCYASSAPGGKHLRLDECQRAIDWLVKYEGRPEILQLSGGEPTVHPQFSEIFEYACSQPIDIVMINTNGVRLASDAKLRRLLKMHAKRCEVYLQFDGFHESTYQTLRGEELLKTKLRTIELLGDLGIHVTLVCTVERGVNLDQVGEIVRFGLERPWVTGVSFQPATYVGRTVLPSDLRQRVTFPDIIQALVEQSNGVWRDSDVLPLPCAHPNAHSLAYAYREAGKVVPLTRFVDIEEHLDLLANGITFNRGRAKDLIGEFLSRQSCGSDCHCGPITLSPNGDSGLEQVPLSTRTFRSKVRFSDDDADSETVRQMAGRFFMRAMAEELSPRDVFRVTTTSFMDAYNFDVRQLMKSCVHHLLPSGHLIPFCAYNLLYRTGRVPLPPLRNVQHNEQLAL